MNSTGENSGDKWQVKISPEQWEKWNQIAKQAALSKKTFTSLGAEDYASTAIEKLLMQKNQPENVEAWLRMTVTNLYIDRYRKIKARGGDAYREWDNDRWEKEMVIFAVRSPSYIVGIRDQLKHIFTGLNEKERELLMLATVGFDNHEISKILGYKSNKIVATRLRQITQKVRDTCLDLRK